MALVAGLTEFLTEQPGLRIELRHEGIVELRGSYLLDATHAAAGRVTRPFELTILVPLNFPKLVPKVFETGGSIPQDQDFHVNGDGSLCLGSPLALRRVLRDCPELQEFFAITLRPFLYAVSLKLDTGQPFLFGELRHGAAGLQQDLADDLRLSESRIPEVLDLVLMPEAEANVMACLCGCSRKLGECEFREQINDLRSLESREWFQRFRQELRAR